MTVTPRPSDFEPLAASDPVPGDTDQIAALGRRYRDTAAEIEAQAKNLRRLASDTIGGWKGQTAQVFQSHAADLATRISKAQARYATAGEALARCAGPMYEAQQDAYAAVWQAKAAEQEIVTNAPAPPRPAGSPPLTAEEKAAETRRQAVYDGASSSLSSAKRKFDHAVDAYHEAAKKAANAIDAEISHDGLKDSWWDRNFGWISAVFEGIAIAVAVLAVITLVLICPLTAGAIAALLGTTTTVLDGVATALGLFALTATVAQTAFDGIAMGTGKESWTSFAIDLASLATFGLGESAGAIIKSLAKGAEGVGETVAAGRAGRAFMSAHGMPGVLYSLGSRFNSVAKVLDWAGQGDKLEGAVKAATDARAALGKAVKDAKPGNLVVLWSMSSDIGEGMAKLAVLNEKVPGVLRIMVPKAAATGSMVTEGGAQWATFAGGNAYNVYQWTSGNDSQAQIDHTITQFRQMLNRVP